MIGILSIGIGNVRSVECAIIESGFDPIVVDNAADFDGLTHLIVPGVGNFGAVSDEIRKREMNQSIHDFVASGRPLLGACLGMQLMVATGEEGGGKEGLGLIAGRVTRLIPSQMHRVPHVGWNGLVMKRRHPIFEGIRNGCDFYFVHSYTVVCDDDDDVLGTTDYGTDVTAVIGRDNVIGLQFHPEKSQVNGLKLIENFCQWDGRC